MAHLFRPTLVHAPSALGLSARGVEHLPQALLDAGLAERLHALPGPRLDPPPHGTQVDAGSGVLNAAAIASFSLGLADAVGQVLDEGGFPLVLGGDCSIVLGNLLALRRRGRPGLFFIDAHSDFYLPEVLPDGEAASMDLAFATGRGPAVVAALEGRRPLVRDEDVVVYGRRDAPEADRFHSPRIEDTAILQIDLQAVRTEGAAASAHRAVARLEAQPIDGYWLHLDADALDDAVMPAVDYRLPGGLSWDELVAALRVALHRPKARGMHVGIFNPELDRGGAVARAMVDALGRAFEP
ncbi:arginase family protein [Schlegelella sp. S2-27]|uniref:Arginase family protein n=1 Tax=Caldimonas mangrovi TaxID=2944811 RepID=A0ABT0YJJ9_9BURK|nr:arginase family protein [Caldimonas mangrovi]MCM5678906.1 arginase family protein [Caldimonas mangrovi]